MLSEILTGESFWFWTLVIVQSGLIIWFAETANPVAAGVTVGTLIVGIAFFPTQWQQVGLGDLQNMSFPTWLSQNAWTLLAGLPETSAAPRRCCEIMRNTARRHLSAKSTSCGPKPAEWQRPRADIN